MLSRISKAFDSLLDELQLGLGTTSSYTTAVYLSIFGVSLSLWMLLWTLLSLAASLMQLLAATVLNLGASASAALSYIQASRIGQYLPRKWRNGAGET